MSTSSPSSRAVRAGAGIPASGRGTEAPAGTEPAMKWGCGCCVFRSPFPTPPHPPPIASHPSVCWSPGFSLFTGFSISQGSWRSSKEQRLSPSRPGEPRETRSPSKGRPQVSSRPGAPPAWRPHPHPSLGVLGDSGEEGAALHGLTSWGLSSGSGWKVREKCSY